MDDLGREQVLNVVTQVGSPTKEAAVVATEGPTSSVICLESVVLKARGNF